ncbi:MAG: cupredoxin domain-containing protein [Sporichthyaceae bacterium]
MNFSLAIPAALLLGLTALPVGTAVAAEKNEQMRFERGSVRPGMISMKAGDSVTWTNKDDEAHALVSDADAPAAFKSPSIAPGSSFTFKVPKGGTYNFRCSMHGEVGMLMVSNADGSYPSAENDGAPGNPIGSLLAPVLPR